MDNLSFRQDSSAGQTSNAEEDIIQAHIETVNAAANVTVPLSEWWARVRQCWQSYHWRMRHYFYIHLLVFFCNTLICGAIVWAIERYRIPYVDCWFVSATCVFTCGLQTYDYALFSRSSQGVLLFYTSISGEREQREREINDETIVECFLGITVSTIPAIFIKIYRVHYEVISSEESAGASAGDHDTLPIRRLLPSENSDSELYARIHSLPNPERLRIRAYHLMIVLILLTCAVIYLTSFLAMGIWLKYHYNPVDLMQGNQTIDPFFAAIVLAITGFNQNGLSPW